MKKQLSDDKKYNILQTVQMMQVLSEGIKIEFQTDLVDTRFKNPAINQHASRIKESANAIQLHLSNLFKNKDDDYFSNEYAVEIHRVLKHFIGMDINKVREFMDGVDEMVITSSNNENRR